ERFNLVDSALAAWKNGTPPAELNTKDWSTHEWLRFIKSLPDEITADQMTALDQAFSFTGTGNCEVADVWYELALHRQYEPAYPAIDTFLCAVGRRKFLTPLYKAMIGTESGKAMAMDIYKRARPTYHYVAVNTLDAMLGWDQEER
ncbi:MAG TPA: leukotriene A4 hydrolase C-terminal domain-containing protein, partial [Chitinophagales bacterium]|nr:leukotriene A4 hydrolase C-terminal domain-containing protein [Chitinophagales bacterium]